MTAAAPKALAFPQAGALAAVLLVMAIAIVAWLRLRQIDLPLERDEGEYAYAGQLLLGGIAPYKLAYNMKWPGTYAAYAAMMAVFGQSIHGIRIGIAVVTSLTGVLMFFFARRLWGNLAAVVAAASQLILSVSVESLGLFGHATHFVVLFAVAGFFLMTSDRADAIFAAGVLLAASGVMKQPGMFFGIAAAVLLASRRAWRELAWLAGGAATTIAVTFGSLAAAGVFPRFWFWTVSYARQYGTDVSRDVARQLFVANSSLILDAAPLLWLLVACGIFFVRPHAGLIAALTGAGMLATIPGFHFRSHYFITLFPAAALLAAAGVSSLTEKLRGRGVVALLPAVVFALAFGMAIRQQVARTANLDARDVMRLVYGNEPFPEAVEIAKYVKAHTKPGDRIAVLGSEPEIYFYAGRKSATGYLYTYPLMEPQPFASQMQRSMIDEITKSKPAMMVIVNVPSSWGMFPSSDRTIFDWVAKIWSDPKSEWVIDGAADIFDAETKYVWGEEARTYRPVSPLSLLVLRRK